MLGCAPSWSLEGTRTALFLSSWWGKVRRKNHYLNKAKKNAELRLIIDGTQAGQLAMKYSGIVYSRDSKHAAEIAQLGER